MKIKCTPDDFLVEELADVAPGGGPFALYRLAKRSLGTFEAVDDIARSWQIARGRISYGGLKDRHAATRQFITIESGPRRDLIREGFELSYLGQAGNPFTPDDIRGNRFHIVLRDMGDAERQRALAAIEPVGRDGVPNYFDDQRFGSLGESGEFIAEPWCRGDYERALWLALAEFHEDDRTEDRRQKQLLRDHWGDWRRCLKVLAPSERREAIAVLAYNPRDARRALAKIRADLRGLYLAAFQSGLWNAMLAEVLRREVAEPHLFDQTLKTGSVPFYMQLSQDERARLESTMLPLPSARLHLEPGPMQSLIDAVLSRRGFTLREMRVKYPRDSFFSKGDRAALVRAAGLAADEAADERYPGRSKLTLRFDLPRGAYATILVKRLTAS